MKTVLKLAMVSGALVMMYSCGNNTSKQQVGEHHEHADSASHHGAHIYMCPMNCENGKTYPGPGTCPKCGMNLEHTDEAPATHVNYFMKYESNPIQLEAGKAGMLSFTPKIEGKNDEAVPLDVVHEKKLHLIIVSNDLAYFEHIHPEFQANGSYQINVLEKGKNFTIGRGHNETRFDFGGDYTFFADYLPTGGVHKMDKVAVNVKGNTYKQVAYTNEKLNNTIDGLTVSLEADGGKWETNKPMHIKAFVKKDNKIIDANGFENYLGAKAHMVVLRTETFDYLHVHPDVKDGNLDLHTTFEKAGIYRGWVQFQTDGKLHTVDFVIKVEQGTGDANAGHEKHGGNDHQH